MTESLANRISSYFVHNGLAKDDDHEVLAYLAFKFIATAQQILALVVIAVLLDATLQIIAFTLCFTLLKRHAGGAHANKHWVCLTVSTALTATAVLLCKLVALPVYVAVSASAAALVLVLLRAPVIHPNNPKPEKRRKQMRKISICITAAQCAVILLGSILWTESAFLLLPGALGALAAAVTLVMPIPECET